MNNFEKLPQSPSSPVHFVRLGRVVALSLLALTIATAAGHNASIFATSFSSSGSASVSSSTSESSPQVLTQPNSTRGLAIETITTKGEPFSPIAVPSFGPDNRTRITLYALNLNLLPGDNLSSITADAQDGALQLYPLTVEYVGKLAACDEISFVIVRLNDQLGDVGDVLVRLSLHGLVSNRVRVGIGHVGGGPPDDPSPSPTPTPSASPTPTGTHIIAGQVTDSVGNGVDGVTVNLADPAGVILRSTMTTGNGGFSFGGLATGLTGSVRALPTLLFTFSLMTFTNLNADENAMLVGQLRLYSVSGRVTAGSSGLSNATMTCSDGLGTVSTLTDSNGNYSFTQLTAGRNITISAAKPGYAFATGNIYLPNLSSDRTGVDLVGTSVPSPTPTPGPSPSSGSAPTDPNSTGYLWSNMTCVQNVGLMCSNGTITRTAPGSGYGTAYAQANEQIAYGTGAIALQVNSTSDVIRFGLTNSGQYNIVASAITQPSSTTLSGPTFGIALTGSGGLEVWNQESPRMFRPYSCSACVQTNDWLLVYSDEETVRYYRDRGGVMTLLYSSDHNPVAPSYPLHPQISTSTNGAHALVKILQPVPFGVNGTSWVSPTGTTYASGADEAHATTLDLACNGKRPVGPGNTVILADGTYTGSFVCQNSGTSQAPITYRAETLGVYPPTVILANSTNLNTLRLLGDYEIWKNIEITNTSPARITASPGSSNQALIDTQRNNGWRSDGTGNQLINSVVHDEVDGIVSQTRGGTYVYGCVTYNNGFSASDGGAGHGIYVHNEPQFDHSYIINSVSFGNYGLQMQFWNQTQAAPVGNFTFDKVVTMNGIFGVYGLGNKSNISVTNGHMYNTDFVLGYGGETNTSMTATNNYIYGLTPFAANRWNGLTVTGNKFVGKATTSTTMNTLRLCAPIDSYNINNNIYYRGRTGNPITGTNFRLNACDMSTQSNYTFAQWQVLGPDINSTYYNLTNEAGTPFSQNVAVRPNSIDVFVYPNIYENGRSTVVAWNWPLADNVTVNLSGTGLTEGQAFNVISLQSGRTIYSGTYRSSSPTFLMPMKTDSAPIPRIGDAGSTPGKTSPEFMVALVMPVR